MNKEELTREMWMRMHWGQKGQMYVMLYLAGILEGEDKQAVENITPKIKGHWGEYS